MKQTLDEAIAESVDLIDRMAVGHGRDIQISRAATLQKVHDGEIVHPHTMALANLKRHVIFGSAIEAVCQVCSASHARHANDIVHADDCAWVEAKRIVALLEGETE